MKILYRYNIEYKSYDDDTQIRLREFPVVRETPYTYFIKHPKSYDFQKLEKRISKVATNTYAYDTKEKAKEHFIRRTKTRIMWFEFWLDECKKGLELIEKEI